MNEQSKHNVSATMTEIHWKLCHHHLLVSDPCCCCAHLWSPLLTSLCHPQTPHCDFYRQGGTSSCLSFFMYLFFLFQGKFLVKRFLRNDWNYAGCQCVLAHVFPMPTQSSPLRLLRSTSFWLLSSSKWKWRRSSWRHKCCEGRGTHSALQITEAGLKAVQMSMKRQP